MSVGDIKSESESELDSELESLLGELYLKRSPYTKAQRHKNLFELIERQYSQIDPRKVIVIGGTNGKGSVAKALEALFLNHKMSTGLFTSPHLVRVNERIKLNGISISDSQLKIEIQTLKNSEIYEQLGFFEAMTLIACRFFFRLHNVDMAIFEVGLGGIHDPVNAVPHSWSALTQVALDHTELLGDTLNSIAAHKFCIAPKSGVLFLGEAELLQYSESLQRLSADCEVSLHPKTEIFEMPIEKNLSSEFLPRFGFRDAHTENDYSATNSNSFYGAKNLSFALFIFKRVAPYFKVNVDADLVNESFARMVWPGRLHRAFKIGENVYLSGDHNPKGMLALCQTLENHRAKKIHFLVGKNPQKPFEEMKKLLEDVKRSEIEVIPTSLFAGKTSENFSTDMKFYIDSHYKNLGSDEVMVITGSLYLVGGIYKLYGYEF